MLQDVPAKKMLKPSRRRQVVEYLHGILPSERAPFLPGGSVESRHVSLSQPQRSSNRTPDAYPGDRADQGALWISEDPRAAEP